MKHILLAALLLIGVNANADYIKGATGITVGGETDDGGSSAADLDGDFLTPLLVAYGFSLSGDVMGEAEFSFRNNDYDGANSGDAEVMAFAFNVAHSWAMANTISLNAGAGATLGNYDLVSNGDDGFALGMQLFVGLDFKVADRTTIGGEFRHFRTLTDVDVGSADAEFDNTSLLFTAKFDM